MEYYQQGLAIDGDNKLLHEYLGKLYLLMRKYDLAENEMKVLETLCPSSCPERAALTAAIAANPPPPLSVTPPPLNRLNDSNPIYLNTKRTARKKGEQTVTRISILASPASGILREISTFPCLHANEAFELAACASRNSRVDGVETSPTIEAMLDGCPDLDAISICTPPQVHYEAAKLALKSGKHVFLEKPPCATTAQLDRLAAIARESTAPCSRPGIPVMRPASSRRGIGFRPAKSATCRVTWKEDVRQWHPGQTWIWEAGGFGVFDPGINAISILTQYFPEPIFVTAADLFVPSNCASPIAADIAFAIDGGARIPAAFDFRHTGVQTWDIDIETDGGMLKLSAGEAYCRLTVRPLRRPKIRARMANMKPSIGASRN